MPISSKTPPSERAQKSVTGSRAVDSSTRAGEASPQHLLQPGILDQLQDAVFTTDLHGIITSCNQGVGRYGFAPKELVGRKIADFYGNAIGIGIGIGNGNDNSNDQQASLAGAIASVLDKGRFEGELCCRTKSGQNVNVHLCLTLLRDSNAAPAAILGFSISISQKKLLENAPSPTQSAAAAVPLARREIGGTQFLIASPIMHKFMGMVDRVAGHTETVLVTGETGTGKELVARTIHDSSHRHKHALVDINCAALPEHLVESELFGYEKGAFSGADSSK